MSRTRGASRASHDAHTSPEAPSGHCDPSALDRAECGWTKLSQCCSHSPGILVRRFGRGKWEIPRGLESDVIRMVCLVAKQNSRGSDEVMIWL